MQKNANLSKNSEKCAYSRYRRRRYRGERALQSLPALRVQIPQVFYNRIFGTCIVALHTRIFTEWIILSPNRSRLLQISNHCSSSRSSLTHFNEVVWLHNRAPSLLPFYSYQTIRACPTNLPNKRTVNDVMRWKRHIHGVFQCNFVIVSICLNSISEMLTDNQNRFLINWPSETAENNWTRQVTDWILPSAPLHFRMQSPPGEDCEISCCTTDGSTCSCWSRMLSKSISSMV